MKKALAILVAFLAALVTTAPAMTGGIDQLSIYERSVKGGSPYAAKPPEKKHSSKSSTNSAKHRSAAKKAAARKAAARKAAAKKAAARKSASKKATARNTAARQAAAKKAAARQAAAKRAAVKRAAAKSGSSAHKTPQTAAKSANDEEDLKAAPVKASAIAGTNTLKFRPEPPPEQGTDEPSDNATETAGAEPAAYECKKYVPSAGMTVSVPCAGGQ
ncbi:MAG: hypothetical protein KJ622_12425 [Alphaproteobacteria bacterium]|nr:hypothetical protein [Alphaproteobacteria bacterium]